MGCGKSKPQDVTHPGPKADPEPPPPPPPPKPKPEPEPQPEPEPEPEPPRPSTPVQEDVDLVAGKPSSMEMGVSLAYLHRLVHLLVKESGGGQGGADGEGALGSGRNGDECDYGSLTPEQLLELLVMPDTAGKRCRFVETLRPEDAVTHPLYFCWLSPHCGLPMRQVVQLVEDHIATMDPGLPPERAGVWMSCFCINQHNKRELQGAELASVKTGLHNALPTLIYFTKETMSATLSSAPSTPALSTLKGALDLEATHLEACKHAALHGTEFDQSNFDQSKGIGSNLGSPPGTLACAFSTGSGEDGCELGNAGVVVMDGDVSSCGSGADVESAVLRAAGGCRPALVLLRSREGLHGMQALFFKTPTVLHE